MDITTGLGHCANLCQLGEGLARLSQAQLQTRRELSRCTQIPDICSAGLFSGI